MVAIVPSSWLDGNSCCLWSPHASSINNRKAVQKQEEAQDNWKSFPIRVLGEAGLYITTYISVYILMKRYIFYFKYNFNRVRHHTTWLNE